MKRAWLAASLSLLAFPGSSQAQPFPERDLPPGLRPWVPWVRDEVPDRVCPTLKGSAVCLWPGRLDLRLAISGGTFSFSASADRALDVRLPGGPQSWPQDVRLDGRPSVVVEREGGPSVRVTAGDHRLEGRFSWTHLPDSLPVPPRLALVDLAVNGRAIAFPRRDEAGLIWLHADEAAGGAVESLRLQAFRRIADGIPLWVETRLTLEVSGKAREVELSGALLPDTVPVAVAGDLPARLDAGGRLRVQVRAGAFSVTVLARVQGQPAALGPARGAQPWPGRETWAFAADESLRQVELSGLPPVDPSRTDLPAEWRPLPAFAVEGGARLALKEVRRGEAEAPPDRIQLRRQLWLDLSGRGFTVRDAFSGALSRTWRLDLQRPGELGRAAVDRADQLVTANPATALSGVELRRGALNLEADSRLPRTGALPAVGWSTDVESLDAIVHVPPGWWLLTATHVDRAPGAWTARWSLLGLFFVLIVAGGTLRLFGHGWGVVALLAMVASYDEPGAPFLVWISLLGAVALAAVAPPGWLQRIAGLWRGLSLVALLLILVPFLREQITTALYPQVAAAPGVTVVARPASVLRAPSPQNAPATTPPPMAQQEEDKLQALGYVARPKAAEPEQNAPGRTDGGVVGGAVGGVPGSPKAARGLSKKAYLPSSNAALEQDPRAVLQTGPALPQWSWRSYSLSWSGPVKSDQSVRLVLVSPGMSRLLTLVRVALVLLFAVLLWIGTPRLRPSGRASAAAALIAIGAVLSASSVSAQETMPSRALLDDLKKRITRPEACQPECISTSTLRLRLGDGALSFEAEVHAGDSGAWAIPGPPSIWAPAAVRVDGRETSALVRLEDGFLYVRLSPGVHRIEAAGPVPRTDTLTLQLRDRPRQASADAPGWDIAGLRADGPPDTSIQLSRRLRVGERAREESGQYAPWLEVRRTLTLGLTWRVHTEVHRVSPVGAPVSLRVPLIAGEAPTEADLETKDGIALLSLGRDDIDAGWSSTLPVTDALVLDAGSGLPWSEVWRVECSLVWECETDGLVPVSHQAGGVLAPEFRPWPGEKLSLRFRHPQAVAGQTVTIDTLRVETTPGERLSTTVLSLTARASREEPLVLDLPKDAEVQEVTVAGTARPARAEQGKLRLTLRAGTQPVVVRWREARGASLFLRVPTVGLPLPAANVEGVLHLPENRWLLLTRGPAWGPAVLFWSYLLLALIVALALGLLSDTPLGIGAWLLLTLGLSQTSAAGALVVAGFLLALSWRSRRPTPSALTHDAQQVLLVVWAFAAILVLYDVVQTGLLFHPDMQVAGAQSSNTLLRWYSDRIGAGTTPAAGVLSVPLWFYRGLMLAWALWLATSLLRWTSWAWRAFGAGCLWQPLPWRRHKGPPAAPPTPPENAKDAPARIS
jgi:hypothetical protein